MSPTGDPTDTGSSGYHDSEERTVDLPCDTTSLALARELLTGMAIGRGIRREVMDDLLLAMGEAIANAIRYGCPKGSPGDGIGLSIRFESEEVAIEVTDPGTGFDPHSIPDPDVTVLKDGGMGIFFMRNVMDSVEYRKDDRGVTVMMRKRLNPYERDRKPF